VSDEPQPPTPEVRHRMRATGRRDTAAELPIRRILHARGYRYRVDFSPISALRSRPDIVFTRRKLAVYIDGCFWHGCPTHATWPKRNSSFWKEKIEANRERDLRATALLERSGWIVIRIWEHEDPVEAANQIASRLAELATD